MSESISSFFLNTPSSELTLDEEQFIVNNIKTLIKHLISKGMSDGFSFLYKDNFTNRFERLTEPTKIADDLYPSIIWLVNNQMTLFFGEDINIFNFVKEELGGVSYLNVKLTSKTNFHMPNIYLFIAYVFKRKILQINRDKRVVTDDYLNLMG